MEIAAKALALTAVDLLSNPQLVQAAKLDFDKKLAGKTYASAIPPTRNPSSTTVPTKTTGCPMITEPTAR